MIEVDEQFEVAAGPDIVWALLADPYAVVGCVPGAAIVGQQDDGSLETTLTVKFGPLGIAFQGRADLTLDSPARRGSLTARGRDKQGGARFQATAWFSVAEADAGAATVATRGEVEISGRLASMIESGAGVVVQRMFSAFADCLRARCIEAMSSSSI